MPEWSADVVVDEGLVRRLIADQFPKLELASLRPFAEGWDNAVWLVEERWVFRFPRRRIAIPGVEREIAVLPALAGFLRALHDIELEVELPLDPNWRGDMSRRVPMTRKWLAELHDVWPAPPVVDELLERALALPAPIDRVVLHGDLHFRHLLVDEGGTLTGVIDWGDLCCGDPSIDLSLLWSFFPPEGRTVFLETYGPVSEDQLLRARAITLSVCTALALYAHHEALPGVEREALEGLERTVA